MNSKISNGRYYTPVGLANEVAESVISSHDTRILDPCFGRGSLLIASHDRLEALGNDDFGGKLVGIDNDSDAKNKFESDHPTIAEQCDLILDDFFSVDCADLTEEFDIVLMNPPFVRHHLINETDLDRARSATSDVVSLPKTSNLWAYFTAHAIDFISGNGRLAVILPWSFLFASFAENIRELLAEEFGEIEVITLNSHLFENVQERVIVLIALRKGQDGLTVSSAYSEELSQSSLQWERTESPGSKSLEWQEMVKTSVYSSYSEIIEDKGFEPLGKFANIKIGVVTGANDFFILNSSDDEIGIFSDEFLKPIIRNSKNLSKLSIAKSDVENYLLVLPEDGLSDRVKSYIAQGEREGINQRYHTGNREIWYSIPDPESPDGFLHYMTKEIPFLGLNQDGVHSTNTVHQVKFNEGLDPDTRKWIQLSLLSSVSQLSVEIEARTYGGGVLKLEPNDAADVLVCPFEGYGSPPNELLNEVDELLKSREREKAVAIVDEWMVEELGIPRESMESIKKSYNELKEKRLM